MSSKICIIRFFRAYWTSPASFSHLVSDFRVLVGGISKSFIDSYLTFLISLRFFFFSIARKFFSFRQKFRAAEASCYSSIRSYRSSVPPHFAISRAYSLMKSFYLDNRSSSSRREMNVSRYFWRLFISSCGFLAFPTISSRSRLSSRLAPIWGASEEKFYITPFEVTFLLSRLPE